MSSYSADRFPQGRSPGRGSGSHRTSRNEQSFFLIQFIREYGFVNVD
jgi:hypothetical protein